MLRTLSWLNELSSLCFMTFMLDSFCLGVNVQPISIEVEHASSLGLNMP